MSRFQRKRLLWLSVSLVLFVPIMANAEKIGRDSRGTVLVDGRPRLILGFYEYPNEDAKLKELADSGYNLIRVSDPKQLDRLQELGVLGWICTSVQLKEGDTAAKKRLAEKIDAAKKHPALLAWELPDECLWNVWHRREGWMHGGERRALLEKIATSDASKEKKSPVASGARSGERLEESRAVRRKRGGLRLRVESIGRKESSPRRSFRDVRGGFHRAGRAYAARL